VGEPDDLRELSWELREEVADELADGDDGAADYVWIWELIWAEQNPNASVAASVNSCVSAPRNLMRSFDNCPLHDSLQLSLHTACILLA
jgi:hypothetical protein